MPILTLDTQGAACKGCDPEVFFPSFVDDDGEEVFDDGTVFESYGDTSPFYDAARLICAACPMQQPCLEYAMEHHIRFGMFGGLTPIERRRIERRDRRRRLQERRRLEAAGLLEPDFEDDDMVEDDES